MTPVNQKAVLMRADASMTMGSGHVMRLITLATAMRARGYRVVFACRTPLGHLRTKIEANGFEFLELNSHAPPETCYAHSGWLEGSNSIADASECVAKADLANITPDMVVMDHYALGEAWQAKIKNSWPHAALFVIDDLADRPHVCDLLLDQNPGRSAQDYSKLLNPDCRVLAGPRYALLRNQFEPDAHQTTTLTARPKAIVVCMGGADPNNLNLKVLQSLETCLEKHEWTVHVIAGQTNPHLDSLKAWCVLRPYFRHLHIDLHNVAGLMRNCQLAVGAGGVMALERCATGLPSITVPVADNQLPGSIALLGAKAVRLVRDAAAIAHEVPLLFEELMNESLRSEMAAHATAVCDGLGTQRVLVAAQELLER